MTVKPGRETVNGGRILAEMLEAHGVGPLFGMGGFQLLPFYDAIAELGLQHHLINDERAGAFAADAYARVTGRPGICDGTLGPGATNLLTGLVESLNAGVPVVAITGNTNRDHSWKNMTQEARQTAISAGGQGTDPGGDTGAAPGTGPARVRGRHERTSRSRSARRPRGCLSRRVRAAAPVRTVRVAGGLLGAGAADPT